MGGLGLVEVISGIYLQSKSDLTLIHTLVKSLTKPNKIIHMFANIYFVTSADIKAWRLLTYYISFVAWKIVKNNLLSSLWFVQDWERLAYCNTNCGHIYYSWYMLSRQCFNVSTIFEVHLGNIPRLILFHGLIIN